MSFTHVVDKIPAAGLEFTEVLSTEWLGRALGDAFRPVGVPGEAKLEVAREGTSVVVDGELTFTAEFTCSRCAEDVQVTHLLPVRLSFVVGEEPEESEEEADDLDTFGMAADREVIFYQGPEVDLEAPLVEVIIFALPAYPLCAEDCRGVCVDCGQNRNALPGGDCRCAEKRVDPRFAKLASISLPTKPN